MIQWPLSLDGKVLVGAGVTATSVRQYVARSKQVPLSIRLRWDKQLFDAVRFIHSRNVLHGDISCNNVFLNDNLDVKLGNFAGSAIDDLPSLVCYETSHELPNKDISTKTELFALGSTLYEIMTGSKPYKDLPDHEVSVAFCEGRYPDLESGQSYATAEEALREVQLEVATIKEPRPSRFYTHFSYQSLLVPFILTDVRLAMSVVNVFL
ncbi:kinase-like protein [Aaosphaeria arxii CBS 175.79]|uniref:EKC/KEOPS complex subunit BUD32 n=1 Tax=Aaosphaeria arxii CBS 175.79 TaxID=1450172 RepID=A0A6A5YBQ5_9PLEO|nr:kinase-like protein [Aaosphaeria arxii CBS 175.79]KAF2022141.1 kinase-like protein [Aaosphaeria arxii CBS 175.79]